MARTVRTSPYAFPAEIARYLAIEPEAVRRMIRLDKLPAIRLAAKTRRVQRIPLRDFHAWLLKRTQNPVPELASYVTFLADFDATARVRNDDAA